MRWDDLTIAQKKYWLASGRCSLECREKYLCRTADPEKQDNRSCPAYDDPLFQDPASAHTSRGQPPVKEPERLNH